MPDDNKKPAVSATEIAVPDAIADKVTAEDAGRLGSSIVWGRVTVAVIIAITQVLSAWIAVMYAGGGDRVQPAASVPDALLGRISALEAEATSLRRRIEPLEQMAHPRRRSEP